MRNFITSLIVIGLIFSTSCMQQEVVENPEDEAKVAKELMIIWEGLYEGMNNKDIDKVMSYFTNDYVNYPTYGSTQVGHEETKMMLNDFIQSRPYHEIDLEQIEVKLLGNYAYEVSQDGNQRGFTIFQKQDDGTWKFYRWNGQQKITENNPIE